MLTDSRGHVNVTIVDGTTFTGIQALDGSLNVYDASTDTTPVGLYHPCGAMNIYPVSGTDLTGRSAPNGAMYVVNDSSEYGIYHPCGAMNVTGLSLAYSLLGSETDGLAFVADDMSLAIRDTTTPANVFLGDANSKLTYTSPSTKYILNQAGIYVPGTTLRCEYDASGNPLGIKIEEAVTNFFLNSRTPVTQNIAVAAVPYTISGLGAPGATLTLSGTATGVLTGTGAIDRDSLTFTPSAGTLTITVSGTWDFVQVEAKLFKSSPIVTAGSTVTRAADNETIATSLFPHNALEGTLVIAYTTLGTSPGSAASLFETAGSDANLMVLYGQNGTGSASLASYNGAGSIQVNMTRTVNGAGVQNKVAFAYAANDFALCANGGTVATDTSATLPAPLTLRLGGNRNVNQLLNGHIRSILYVPRRMSNSELQAVTT